MDQSRKKIIRNDIIVILTPLVIALILLIFTLVPRSAGTFVTVSLKGEEIAKYSLSENISLPIKSSDGQTLLIFNIENGAAFVSQPICKDHSCERMGIISRAGESIICLPSQIVITVEGGGSAVDAVACIFKEAELL
ncbi:MAG: NusG domain II-containing protein [Ruminococcaceae bacterium]|nr:NusG domain II-containing protein [Oscillospiraceae bacterium]